MTTTTIHVFNGTEQATTNQILLFLQPVTVSDNYLFSAWQVLNPSINSYQHTDLSTSISASVAAFGSTKGDYTAPSGLSYGQALNVTNPNNQSPQIGGNSTQAITTDQVGLDNECLSPATDLSVIWYVNGNKVVETNNTSTTTLNPGFTSTFQLKQSVYLMFGQVPTSTTTYTIQTFSKTTEIPVPNGATDLYIEAYTNNGIDTFKAVTAAEWATLTGTSSQAFHQYRKIALLQGEAAKLRGTAGDQIVTRDIKDVNVLPLHGDSMLGGHGIGHIDFNGTAVTQLRCGIFAQGKPIPSVGTDYVITGFYDDSSQLPFKYTLKCSNAGRPVSYFAP